MSGCEGGGDRDNKKEKCDRGQSSMWRKEEEDEKGRKENNRGSTPVHVVSCTDGQSTNVPEILSISMSFSLLSRSLDNKMSVAIS